MKFLVELSFCVSNETTTKVITASGMEMIPGLSSGMGAFSANKPYFSYMLGDKSIIPMEDTIPTKIDQAMPFAVVFFQNSKNRMAGRLAEAATAKARPTRNETFIPLNNIPKRMAKNPTPIAANLPALTLPLSVIPTCKY